MSSTAAAIPTIPVVETEMHRIVRESYAKRVKDGEEVKGCCAKKKAASYTMVPSANIQRAAENMGYSLEDVASAPEESNLGLGCGAPLTLAKVQTGETVLDLGSGAGFDAFLASRAVGPTGRVLGVDFTPEMVDKARSNAGKRDEYANVEFRRGYIEALPVESDSVDLVISNCVINLSPDKPAVFREAYRVLKADGGRMAVSDICLTCPLPEAVAKSLAVYVGCIAGASLLEDYVQMMRDAGFVDVKVQVKGAFDVLAGDDPIVAAMIADVEQASELERLKGSVVSASVVAYK